MEPIISMQNISKEFSGVRVLDQVHFNIYPGKVMALLGENGAGKSTLMKILTGVYTKTSGDIYLEGKLFDFKNTRDSQGQGIVIIHQELNLLSNLSIGENIFLGRPPLTPLRTISWKTIYSEAKKWLDRLGLDESPKTLIRDLSVGKRQLVEIAKALSLNAKVIIMDEPTGALTQTETEKLFQVIEELRAEGKSFVYISHRLPEIFRICDGVTVLRDGQFVAEKPIEGLDEDQLIEMMVGRKLEEQYPRIEELAGKVTLDVRGLSNRYIKNVSFKLHEGEILGVAGLMGAGRTELMRTIFGIYNKREGDIFLYGKKLKITNPGDAINSGIAYVSEDRKANGIILDMTVRENTSLSVLRQYSYMGFLSKAKEIEAAERYIEEMSIRTSGVSQLMRFLSGGNQQKVSIAKNLEIRPSVLILDEPTRGVDVGAKKEIYDLINKFKKNGMSIIMISSEIPELLGMSDRIMVMHEGKIAGVLSHDNADQESIMALAVGKTAGEAGKEVS